MTNAIATSETLNLAADLIEERGWVQGSLGWPDSPQSTEPLCLEGGILAAMGLDISSVQLEIEIDVPNTCLAGIAVREYLALGDQVELYQWNDEITGPHIGVRTAAEVIEVLRAAALIEAAKENADVREPVSA